MAAREDKPPRPDDTEQPGDGGPGEAARFVGETAADLATLARRHRLDMLAHLLEMARMEADEILRRNIDPNLN